MKTYSSRVYGHAVILIVHDGVVDEDVRAVTDVEAVSVVRHLVSGETIAGRVINRHIADGKAAAAVDADGLDRRVQEVEVVDRRGAGEAMSSQELWLWCRPVATKSVPVLRSLAVELRIGIASDDDVFAANT